jgi:hypothetical protein
VVDAVLTADLFRIIQRCRTVAVRDDEDMFHWEDLLRSHKCRADDIGGFVLPKVSIMFVCVQLSTERNERIKCLYVRMGLAKLYWQLPQHVRLLPDLVHPA